MILVMRLTKWKKTFYLAFRHFSRRLFTPWSHLLTRKTFAFESCRSILPNLEKFRSSFRRKRAPCRSKGDVSLFFAFCPRTSPPSPTPKIKISENGGIGQNFEVILVLFQAKWQYGMLQSINVGTYHKFLQMSLIQRQGRQLRKTAGNLIISTFYEKLF